jgi:transposase
MNREIHVRICGRLGAKFPGRTRQNRKGHKTDRKDAGHLADLLRHNHVKSSYIPAEPVRQLLDLTRRRVQLTQDATRERNRVQKLLEQVNVKIGSVLTDVFGVSGLHMLLALLDGRAAPEEIAGLARGSAKRKTPQLIEAIEGNRMSDHVRFLIRGCLRHLACLEEEVEELEAEILRRMQLSTFQKAFTLLQTIPGVGQLSAATILAETGPDLDSFPTIDEDGELGGLVSRESGKCRHSERTTNHPRQPLSVYGFGAVCMGGKPLSIGSLG